LAWTVEVSGSARKQLDKLGSREATQITRYLRDRIATADDPRQFGKGLAGELSGHWRYRVGDYRIICQIIDQRLVVLVVELGHRRDIYR